MAGAGFKLTVDGAPIAPELLAAVRRVVVEDHAELADMVRLRIGTAVAADGAGWSVLDDPGFGRLSRLGVTVAVGDNAPEPLIDAYVVQVAPQLSGDPGDSFVDIVGMDATVLLGLEEKIRAWPDQSDSAIATTIFGEHDLQPDVEETGRTRSQDAVTTVQRGTDMQFLRSLAERNGYELFVESDAASGAVVGHFHAPRPQTTPQGTLTVAGGQASNVDRFTARFDMLRPATAEVQGLDAGTGETRTVEVTAPAIDQLGARPPANGDRPRKVIVSSPATADAGELEALAQAVVDRASWALTAEGDLAPAAYGGVLRAKRPVLVRGVGPTFSGTWYVEKVVHVLAGDSYEQRFTLRRNAVGVQSSDRFTDDRGQPA